MFLKIRSIREPRQKLLSVFTIIFFMSFIWSFAISSIMYGVFLLFFFIDKKNVINKLKLLSKNRTILIYGLYFMIILVGLSYSKNWQQGLDKVISLSPLIILPAIWISEQLNLKHFEVILNYVKYLVIFSFLLLIFNHLYIESRQLGTFVQYAIYRRIGASQFYIAFILFIPILHCFYELEKKKQIALNILCITFLFFCVMILNNKTSFVLAFVLLVVGLFKVLRTSSLKIKILSIITISLVFLILMSSSTKEFKTKYEVFVKTTDFDIEIIKTKNSVTYTQNTFEHRILIWYISLSEIIKNLPFGVGTGDYQEVLNNRYEDINFKTGLKLNLNCHNQYFTEFLRTGLLGGAAFLILIFYLIQKASFTDKYYLFMIFSFAISCFFESLLERQHGVMIFAFFIPFFLSYDKELKSVPHE